MPRGLWSDEDHLANSNKSTRAQTSVPRIYFQNIHKHQKTILKDKNKGFLSKLQVIYRFYEKKKDYIGSR